MKKILGIVLALALVLAMTLVVTAPAAALTAATVTVAYPYAGQPSAYTITFTTGIGLAVGDSIAIKFPTGTGNLTAITTADVKIGENSPSSVTVSGQTLGLTLNAVVPAGSVTVVVGGAGLHNLSNPSGGTYTLDVTTTYEGPVTSSSYVIYWGSLSLAVGWNLMSLPCIPANSAPAAVLASLLPPATTPAAVESVWTYNALTNKWYFWSPTVTTPPAGYSTLTAMVDGQAYWIKMTTAGTLNLAGTGYPVPPSPPLVYSLAAGWNMVGYTPGMGTYGTWGAYLTSGNIASSAISAVYGYSAGSWHNVGTGGTPHAGDGVWVFTSQAGQIVP